MSKLLENLNTKSIGKVSYRRYNLSEIISESYGLLYKCKKGTTMRKMVESHIADVKENPRDIDRLSRQLCDLKKASTLIESCDMKDSELLVSKEDHDTVESKEDRSLGLKESKDDEDVEEKDDENLIDESVHDEDVAEEDDEDLLEADLTDEELEELSKHLEEYRKNKKPVTESSKGRKLKRRVNEDTDSRIFQYGVDIEQAGSTNPSEVENDIRKILQGAGYDVVGCMAGDTSWSRQEYGMFEDKSESVKESASWDKISLAEFNKNSSSKAFVKTFKKLDSKLHEGTALTRQESISLYKAANSAMTHLSVELEHNPDFLETFKESTSLLSVDVEKLLASLKEGKGPSKATMKSLAKFSEALLREAEEDEEELDIEGEENEVADEETPEEEVADEEAEEMAEESEEFDQEYAEARVELHKELADEHADTENPEIEDKLYQDAEEVINLPGITDEQVAEITGDEAPAEEEASEEEAPAEEDEVEVDLELDDDEDITDDELAELKKHLTEMRKARRAK